MRSTDFCSPQRLKKDSLSISNRYCSSTAVKGPPLLPPVKYKNQTLEFRPLTFVYDPTDLNSTIY